MACKRSRGRREIGNRLGLHDRRRSVGSERRRRREAISRQRIRLERVERVCKETGGREEEEIVIPFTWRNCERERDSNPRETLAASEKKGLEPKRRKAIDGGYRLRFVMDSGAAKTIVPRDAIPGMKMSRSKGGSFRMAHGNVIPNLGEAEIKGLGALNSHPQQFGTQVADVTKPLAAATEAVDGGRTIILHRT